MDASDIARRLEFLRLARASSAMEGLRTDPEDAAAQEAYLTGKIDRAEFERRIRERIAREISASKARAPRALCSHVAVAKEVRS